MTIDNIDKRKRDLELALSFKNKPTNNYRGALVIFRDYTAISIIIAINLYFKDNLLLHLISIWLIGAFQFAISECLLHETSHYALFGSRKLNEYSEIFTALPFFTTHKFFKEEHLIHHNFLMQEKDHLLEAYKYFGFVNKEDDKTNDKINLFWHLIFRPILGISGIYHFFANADFKNFKVIIFWIVITALAFHYNFIIELIFYWLIPFVWCCGSFLYWSEFLDHYKVENKYGRTRTCKISNIIFHNNGYHLTHHKYPFISSNNLKTAYEALDKEGDTESCKNIFDFFVKEYNGRKNLSPIS